MVFILTDSVKNFMASKKESDKEGVNDRITRIFLDHMKLWVILMVITGVALIFGGYYLQQTRYIFWAPSFISLGSSLIAIGLVAIAFKAAAVQLFEDEKIIKTARLTIEEMEHTFIPKMITKRANFSITIVTSENNNKTPKMKICEQTTMRNLQERAIDQKKKRVQIDEDQHCKIKNIEVNIKGSNYVVKPFSVEHSDIITSSKKMKKIEYTIPFVASLNKGEDVCIKEEYEWSPCKATPNTPNYDEFYYILAFPTEELLIEMKAEEKFYFVSLEKSVTDWLSGREISVQSGPIVTKESNGFIKEAKWNIPLTDLTHLTIYKIRFRLGIM